VSLLHAAAIATKTITFTQLWRRVRGGLSSFLASAVFILEPQYFGGVLTGPQYKTSRFGPPIRIGVRLAVPNEPGIGGVTFVERHIEHHFLGFPRAKLLSG
jgi:hypothetical protein